MIIVDAAPIIAAADSRDPRNGAAKAAIRGARQPLIIPAPVTAEIDYLLDQRVGDRPRLQFYADIAVGHFQVECLTQSEYQTVLDLQLRYASLNPGLADLSLVVLARRFRTTNILTFDERHFRFIEPLQGGRFTILPTDTPEEHPT